MVQLAKHRQVRAKLCAAVRLQKKETANEPAGDHEPVEVSAAVGSIKN